MITVGMSVKIQNSKYCDLADITYGTVRDIYFGWEYPVAVEIMNNKNPHSSKGYFYFKLGDVEECTDDVYSVWSKTMLDKATLIPRDTDGAKRFINAIYGKTNIDKMEDNRMKNQQLINGYNVARINFKGSETITNFALYDDTIKVDDFVLCMTGHHGEAIGRVVEIVPKNDELEGLEVSYGREVICKIDYSAYEARKNRLKQISKLKVKMAKKREELNELAVYQALAKDCPEMADMLKELKELL